MKVTQTHNRNLTLEVSREELGRIHCALAVFKSIQPEQEACWRMAAEISQQWKAIEKAEGQLKIARESEV